MTEMAEGTGQSVGNLTAQNSFPAPNTAQEAPQAATGERSFKQSEVDDIVKRAKNEAVDRYRRLNAEQPSYAQQKYGDTTNAERQEHATVRPAGFDEGNYRRIAAEEAKRHLDQARQDAFRQSEEEAGKRIVQNFYAKTGKGREKFQDFDQVTGDVELGRFPNVVQLLGEFVENPEDVFYELGKDRIKFAQLETLAERSPRDAIIAAKKLSQSIRENNEAAKAKVARQPLEQLKPSNYGTDAGALSVSDFRKKYRG